jgi:O-antigen chain-terminating methyltransferase
MGSPDVADPLYKHLSQKLPTSGRLVDLGCGRGRWLKFANERGMDSLGVDNHPWSVEHCVNANLNVTLSEIWDFFDRDEATGVSVFSAFHLVEHLTPDKVQHLINLIAQGLQPGGLCILVTPNFSDWSVAREIFWIDPTHIRPYPLPLLQMMCESAGLQISYRRNVRLVKSGIKSSLFRQLNRLRFGHQYGLMNSVIVAAKPRAPLSRVMRSSP